MAGPGSNVVQVLDAQQNRAAGGTPFRWFSSAEPPPDSGEIDSHHSLLALVHRIYSLRLTGKLQIVFGRVEKALFFDAGELMFATSSDRQDGLGEVMLRAGALTQSQFEEASTLVETGQRFGSAIAEMGIYGVDQIIGWVQRQVLQITASVLDYPAGRYFFFSSLEKNVVPEIGNPVPLGKLLLEAVRKAGDLPLDQLAGDAALEVEIPAHLPRSIKPEDLQDHERRFLSSISQRASAKQLVLQSGLPALEAARALYALLLSDFVVPAPDHTRTEPAPVVLTSPSALEQPKPVEAPSAAILPEQQNAAASLPAEEPPANAGEPASTENTTQVQPQPEQSPEEPGETDAPLATPLPLLKPNPISREVPLRATGISAEKNEPGRQLFSEETVSLLVAETGGVIQLSAAVLPGQLLLLNNLESKREVIVQVLRKRVFKPTMCYLEVEFVEAAPGFWGTEFSAAAALLPKNSQDVKTASLVIAAEATADQPPILPTAPDATDIHAFKRELETLHKIPALTQEPPADAETRALAQLRGELDAPSTAPALDDSLSTQSILESGLAAAGAAAPAKRDPVIEPWEEAEQPQTPQSLTDLINSMPQPKRWRMPRGGFTPEFNRAVLMLAVLLLALVVGTAWFKKWLPWQYAGAKLKKSAASQTIQVASDAPLTSSEVPAKTAPVSNEKATAPAHEGASTPDAAPSRVSVEPLASKKKTFRSAAAPKSSSVQPSAQPAANSLAASGQDSAVIPPKLIHSVQAVASLDALRDFERGDVVVDAVVGTSGEVHFISVLSGPPSLRGPAVEALKQYQYKPATRDGQPVPAHVTIKIHFHFESQ